MEGFDHVSGEYLIRGDAKIYYEVKGKDDHPVILFLHGGFGNMEDFNIVIAELDKEYKVVGIDSRGQGRSTLGSEPLSYELLQQDAERVLAHLNIGTLIILGFSDGGIVAYRLAAFSKLKIKKLITIGSRWLPKTPWQ